MDVDKNVWTHVFDIRARKDSDHVAVLDTEVVSYNSVNAGATVIKLLIGQDNEDGVLSLLASDKNCVTSE